MIRTIVLYLCFGRCKSLQNTPHDLAYCVVTSSWSRHALGPCTPPVHWMTLIYGSVIINISQQ